MAGPNLLFVFADQMRGMDMGCAGNADIHTPHLDAMAAAGRRYSRAIANTPVCGPNRASMLTGLLPMRVGVPANDLALRSGVATLGTIARDNGYQTGYIGKWHLDGLPRDKFTPPGERRFGFDYWAAFNCFHDYFTPRYFRDTPEMIRPTGYEPVVQTDLAIEFLRQVDRSKPFALVLSWGPPHDPYSQVPQPYRDLYDANSLTLRSNVSIDAENPLARRLDCRETLANYYAAISALDEQVGRLRKALHDLHLTDDTLVVFTSDHGDMLWSHGLMKKQLPYQESLSVPLLACQPGRLEPGSRSESIFGSIDLLPTLCGLLNWNHDVAFDGANLSGTFSTAVQREDSLLIGNYLSSGEAEKQGVGDWRGLYTGENTYVEKTPGEPWLFFDNDSDPFQMSNIVAEPSCQSLCEQFSVNLHARLSVLGDGFRSHEEMVVQLGIESEWNALSGPLYSAEHRHELSQKERT